jgi:hypothetical protein
MLLPTQSPVCAGCPRPGRREHEGQPRSPAARSRHRVFAPHADHASAPPPTTARFLDPERGGSTPPQPPGLQESRRRGSIAQGDVDARAYRVTEDTKAGVAASGRWRSSGRKPSARGRWRRGGQMRENPDVGSGAARYISLQARCIHTTRGPRSSAPDAALAPKEAQ